MRRSIVFFLSLWVSILQAQSTFDKDRLESFYDTFGCEQKNVTSEVGLTGPCTETPAGMVPTPPTPPTPPNPPPSSDYFPIILVNNTGVADNLVYFVIYGQTIPGPTSPATNNIQFVGFGAPAPAPTSTTGALVPTTGVNTPPSSAYSYTIAQIKALNADGRAIVYIPHINSGVIYFSINSALTLTVSAGSVSNPTPEDNGDTNYPIVYGFAECTFLPTGQYGSPPAPAPLNQIDFDVTCLNFFGLSISLDLYTNDPDPGIPNNQIAGILQGRSTVLANLTSTFNTSASATRSQWNSLLLSSGGTTLRCLSPGYSMSHPSAVSTFDTNYLDNLASYGYSWASNVWTGASAYYLSSSGRTLTITTNDGTVFTGFVTGGNFVFTSPNGDGITIPWYGPSGTPGQPVTTTMAIYNIGSSFPGMTFTGNGAAYTAEFTKIFGSAFFVGILPGMVTKLNGGGPPATVIPDYYTTNTNLPGLGDSAGPWYDLYSLAILGNGNSRTPNIVYTYPYTDFLYSNDPTMATLAPSLRLVAGPNGTGQPYVTITLGSYSAN